MKITVASERGRMHPAGADEQRTTTMTEVVREKIRSEILSGSLVPGGRLTLHALKKQYGTGMSPLREALWRLNAEGLVTVSSHKGFRVSTVFRDELVDITRLRIVMEGLALEEALRNGDDEWEAGILSTFHRLSKLRPEDGPQWDEWHRAFHDALVSSCRSPVLQQLRKQLFDGAYRYYHVGRRFLRRWRDDLGEHRAIMDACLARDVRTARERMAEHLNLTAEMILEAFDKEGRVVETQAAPVRKAPRTRVAQPRVAQSRVARARK